MREWWPMVLNHNRNRFRPFPAKSNDSNWIRSPKSMFWDIIGCLRCPFWPLEREPEFSKSCGLCRMTVDHKIFHFREILAKSNDSFFIKVPKASFLAVFVLFRPNTNFPEKSDSATFYPFLGPFWTLFAPKTQNKNFPEKSDSATFYPLYPSNFMQKNQKKVMKKSWEKRQRPYFRPF